MKEQPRDMRTKGERDNTELVCAVNKYAHKYSFRDFLWKSPIKGWQLTAAFISGGKYLLYNNLELVTSEQHIPARQASSTSIMLLQAHHCLSTVDCASQLGRTFYPWWSTAYTVL